MADAFAALRIAVLTVSDTRDSRSDTSGAALVARLEDAGHVLHDKRICRDDIHELRAIVSRWIADEAPDVVILAAAKVGGIMANNTYPAEFIYENLMIECNVIHQAFAAGVQQLLQLGSSCIYPRDAAQPMAEEALLTGPLEPAGVPL